MNNPLIKTLLSLRGNPRACVYTEPFWGLSINLCIPYASVYMLALGLTDSQVGLITTVYMTSQIVFAFFSGPVTDKMGRRKAATILDFVAWCIPCVIWYLAEDFWFFFVAALINGTQRIVSNAWGCLLVEDAEKSQITGLYSLVGIAAQLSVLFVPISAILFSRLTLVPAIRILYINGFVLMTLKVVFLYIFSRETQRGMIRLEETRGKSILSLAAGYGGVLKTIGKSRGIIFTMIVITIAGGGSGTAGIVGMINNAFWQVIVSKKLLVPNSFLPFFVVLRSLVAIFFLFFVMPRLTKGHLRLPLLTAFSCYLIGQLILVITPVEAPFKYIMLCVSLVFDGFGLGALPMLANSLTAFYVNSSERARMIAIQQMIIMPVTAPFGWIAGMLSDISRNLPFILNICLLLAGFCITFVYYMKNPQPRFEIHA